MADIFISRINCTEINISKLFDIFHFTNVIAEISDVKKCDALFQKIEQLKLKHATSFEDESPYIDIVVMTTIKQFKGLIKHILESNSEAFVITNIGSENQWEQYLYNKIPIRKLIKRGKINLSIDVAIRESEIGISLGKETCDILQVVREIKAMF